MPDLSGKIIIVTGANAGIGKVTARELARMGAHVVMVCRSRERGTEALNDIKAATGSDAVRLMLCDLSSQASIRAFIRDFTAEYNRLDVLVNNAGAVFNDRRTSAEGFELTFALNHMGYFQLTLGLLDLLKRSAPARIVNVSSDAHRVGGLTFGDLQREQSYSAFRVYGESKLMNIMFTYALARRLEGTGVTVNALHPGFVRTNFGRNTLGWLGKLFMPLAHLFARDVEEGASTTIYLASSEQVEGVTGEYFVDSKAVRSSDESYDEAAQEKLWRLSEELLAVPA